MKKIRISILILSIFILTIPVSSYAQICSTGHFVFDVPDSWRFMTYEDSILYNVDGGNGLFVFENDMRWAGDIRPGMLGDFYRTYTNKPEGTITRINGDPAYYFVEKYDQPYSSLKCDDYSVTFLFYKNGYLLYLSYLAKYPVTKEECVDTMLKISNSISYSIQDRTTYDLQKEITEHFIYGVPKGWFHAVINDVDYYYGGNEMTDKGGMYSVIEYPLSSIIEDVGEMELSSIYHYIANSLYSQVSENDDLTTEEITINGLPAYSSQYFLDIYTGYVYQTFLAYGDYLFISTYSNSEGASDEQYSVSIVEALRDSIKPIQY